MRNKELFVLIICMYTYTYFPFLQGELKNVLCGRKVMKPKVTVCLFYYRSRVKSQPVVQDCVMCRLLLNTNFMYALKNSSSVSRLTHFTGRKLFPFSRDSFSEGR